jgi:CHAD domain-containing protein
MKHKEILQVLENKFIRLGILSRRVVQSYEMEDIHMFRVEVKKLRAFLRMVRLGAEIPEILHLPMQVRTLYVMTGNIRNRQLMIHRLRGLVVLSGVPHPEVYLGHAKSELSKLITQAGKEAIDEKKMGG